MSMLIKNTATTKQYRRRMWQLGAALVIAGIVFGIAKPVLAYTQNDLLCVYQHTCGYDPTDTTQPAVPCGGGIDNLTGSDSEEKVWNFLTEKGLDNYQAAGVLGNLLQESALDPKIQSPGGAYTGIAQWNTEGRWAQLVTWAHSKQLDEYSLDTQMQYLWDEATERGNIKGIKKYDDIAHTTWYWGRYFEVAIINGSQSETPLTNVQNLDERTAAAQREYDKFSGASVGADIGETDEEAADDTDGVTPNVDSTGCSDDENGGGDDSGGNSGGSGVIGIGKGGFTDSGKVKGVTTVLENSKLADKVYGSSLEWKGWCASIVSLVWHGKYAGFGFQPYYAGTLAKTKYVHKDNKPMVGSILLYTGSTKYGHVNIYLGNNRVLNDAHIVDATVKAKDFVGWVDPNDIGWTTQKISSSSAMHNLLDKYRTPAAL
jgi:hypothetical protein